MNCTLMIIYLNINTPRILMKTPKKNCAKKEDINQEKTEQNKK